MRILYIIGNGFDRAHDLETGYGDFHEWLQKSGTNKYRAAKEFVYNIVGYTKGVDLWSEFERALGAINTTQYLKDIVDEYKSEQPEDNWTAQEEAVYAAIEYIIKVQYRELIQSFCDWARDIKTDWAEEVYQGLKSNEHYFLTFNYTDTLENTYSIPSERVLHIHGYAKDPKSEIIVGHNNDYRTDSRAITALLNNVLPADGGDTGEKLIEMLNETFKDTSSIIGSHSQYFRELAQRDIEKIVVLGHSYGEVDWPYFKKIKECCPNAEWEFNWFSCNDYEKAKELRKYMSLPKATFVQTSSESKATCWVRKAMKPFVELWKKIHKNCK